MKLNTWRERFEALGVHVVGMTYDKPEVLSGFAEDEELAYPFLSDPDGGYVAKLGIRNDEYGPGHPGFGIPHPGIMLIGPSRTILYKAAEEDYRQRPAFDAVFAAVAEALGATDGASAAKTESATEE